MNWNFNGAGIKEAPSLLAEIFAEAKMSCNNPRCACSSCACKRQEQRLLHELGWQLNEVEEMELGAAFKKIRDLAKKGYNKAKPLIATADIIRRLVFPPTEPVPVMKDIATYVEQDKKRQTQQRVEQAQLPQQRAYRQQPPEKELSVLQEIFGEVLQVPEVVVLELSPESLESEAGKWLKGLRDRILSCMQKAHIPGIRNIQATASKDAEIVLELERPNPQQVQRNKRRGNQFRNAIGAAMRNCPGMFGKVQVEGEPGFRNRVAVRQLGPRFIDTSFIDRSNGKRVNIEVKRGTSRYLVSQKQKDSAIEKMGMGPTFVLRGVPGRKRKTT